MELTLSPKACFFFGLAHLGRNADDLRTQLLPWRGTQSRIHNRNPWQDARLRLRGKKRVECVIYCSKLLTSNMDQLTLPLNTLFI